MTTGEIVEKIQSFDPSSGDPRIVEQVVAEALRSLTKSVAAHELLKLTERYPEDDGIAFWGIIHGLEAIGDYEESLKESLSRFPSFISVLMANRMYNAGEGHDWIPRALENAANSPSTPKRVADISNKFLARIRS